MAILLPLNVVSALQFQFTIDTLPYMTRSMMQHLLPEILKNDNNLYSLVRIMKTSDYGFTDSITSICHILDRKTLLGMRDFAAKSREIQSMLLSSDCIATSQAISKDEINELFSDTIAALPEEITEENLDSFLKQIKNIEEIDPYLNYRLQSRWFYYIGDLYKLINVNSESAIDNLLYKYLPPIRFNQLNGNLIASFVELIAHRGKRTTNTEIKAASILSLLIIKHNFEKVVNFQEGKAQKYLSDLENSFATSCNSYYEEFKKESQLSFSNFHSPRFFDENSAPEVIALAGWFVAHGSNRALHSYFLNVIEAIYTKLSNREYLMIVDAVIHLTDDCMGDLGQRILGISRNRLLSIRIPQSAGYILSCLDMNQRVSYFRRWERELPERSNFKSTEMEDNSDSHPIRHYWAFPAKIGSISSKDFFAEKVLEYTTKLREKFKIDFEKIQGRMEMLEFPWKDKQFGWDFSQFLLYHTFERLYFSSSLTLSEYLVFYVCCEMKLRHFDRNPIFLTYLSDIISIAYSFTCPEK